MISTSLFLYICLYWVTKKSLPLPPVETFEALRSLSCFKSAELLQQETKQRAKQRPARSASKNDTLDRFQVKKWVQRGERNLKEIDIIQYTESSLSGRGWFDRKVRRHARRRAALCSWGAVCWDRVAIWILHLGTVRVQLPKADGEQLHHLPGRLTIEPYPSSPEHSRNFLMNL